MSEVPPGRGRGRGRAKDKQFTGRGRCRGDIQEWKKIARTPGIRQPHNPVLHPDVSVTTAQASISTVTSTVTSAVTSIVSNSTLSPGAAEFIPQKVAYLAPQDHSTKESQNEKEVINLFVCLMTDITLSPGRFIVLTENFFKSLKAYTLTPSTITKMVDLVVDQSIYERNFRYNGARLCRELINSALLQKTNFKVCLLERWKEEVQFSLWTLKNDSNKAYGFLLFSGELFLQLYDSIPELFSKEICKMIHFMLNEVSEENIKTICQLLKMAGKQLYWVDQEGVVSILEKLNNIARSGKLLGITCEMVNSVKQLSHTVWREPWVVTWPTDSTPPVPTPLLQNEPVFYGPDGNVLTQEETLFLQNEANSDPTDAEEEEDEIFWGPDGEEMDEETEAAYEEFLKLSLQK